MGGEPRVDGRVARRLATQDKLVSAVGQALREEGVEGLRINALARRAGVDKALIYRYFGDLEGLLRAYGATCDFWPDLDELLGADRAILEAPVDEMAAVILTRYAAALRRRPQTLRLLAWEAARRNELTVALESIRETRARELYAALAEAGVDLDARATLVLNLIVAGLQYLTVRGQDIRWWAGMELTEEGLWGQLEGGLREAFAALFSPKAPR